MTAIVLTPHLDKAAVWREGIWSVPAEMATVRCACPDNCRGLAVGDFPLTARTLELDLTHAGNMMIEQLAPRGYEWLDTLVVHGPFASKELGEFSDIASAAFKSNDPRDVLSFVRDRVATSPYKDYILVGNFLKRVVVHETKE